MSFFESVILGIIQGLTEFLPVSSSGHLILFQHIMGQKDVPLLFDVLLHVASLVAVLIFFRKKILSLLQGVTKKGEDSSLSEIVMIIAGTIVTVAMVVFTKPALMHIREHPKILGFTFMFTAVILVIANNLMKRNPDDKKVSLKDALFIGFFQGLAVLPGISRSGSTIAAGLFRKLPGQRAVEFSFLLAIPAIAGAMVLEIYKGEWGAIELIPTIAGCSASLISSLFALKLLVIMVKKTILLPFSVYLFFLSLSVFVFK
jgi:undecaprenyl-diphosphatase